MSVARTKSLIADSDDHFAVLIAIQEGDEVFTVGNSRMELTAGDMVLWDSHQPAKFEIDRMVRKRSLMIPGQVFDLIRGPKTRSGKLLSSPASQLLGDYLGVLTNSVQALPQQSLSSARNATLELIAGMLRSEPGGEPGAGTAVALRTAIESWIDAHLRDNAITPAQVAAAHSVSVRTVNRVFAENGDTLGAVVRRRRLMRARADLEATQHSVAAIAARWNFSDASHLTRSFKQQFGLSPSAFRAELRDRTTEVTATEFTATTGEHLLLPAS
ncbi:helix-turn-helix domain-containing protein [Gordonia phthalatica]|uniref:helix-turn-helix domain-containing protein n=1 Tax=Gordonia phthalatica TaxID=1136941 RepID=UPI001F014D48|nr:helix-turn-helix domain-containing protein [Gordonia phthalatica]